MSENLDNPGRQISRLLDEGDDLLHDGHYEKALSRYRTAWDRLPEPREDQPVALSILAAIADVHFFRGDFAKAKTVLMKSLWCSHGEPIGIPYIRLRIGQCLFELGNLKEAGNWLAPAYLLEGKALFEQDDPKYLDFLKSQLDPPPGGWPEGW